MKMAEKPIRRIDDIELQCLRDFMKTQTGTRDGFLVEPDVTIYCPKGHAHVVHASEKYLYCCEGICWDDGCQSDSGSGTRYSWSQCSSQRLAPVPA
jgi:hypothetical protein